MATTTPTLRANKKKERRCSMRQSIQRTLNMRPRRRLNHRHQAPILTTMRQALQFSIQTRRSLQSLVLHTLQMARIRQLILTDKSQPRIKAVLISQEVRPRIAEMESRLQPHRQLSLLSGQLQIWARLIDWKWSKLSSKRFGSASILITQADQEPL